MPETKYKISWFDIENSQVCSLTGTKNSVESVVEAITFYGGAKDIKIETVKP